MWTMEPSGKAAYSPHWHCDLGEIRKPYSVERQGGLGNDAFLKHTRGESG